MYFLVLCPSDITSHRVLQKNCIILDWADPDWPNCEFLSPFIASLFFKYSSILRGASDRGADKRCHISLSCAFMWGCIRLTLVVQPLSLWISLHYNAKIIILAFTGLNFYSNETPRDVVKLFKGIIRTYLELYCVGKLKWYCSGSSIVVNYTRDNFFPFACAKWDSFLKPNSFTPCLFSLTSSAGEICCKEPLKLSSLPTSPHDKRYKLNGVN